MKRQITLVLLALFIVKTSFTQFAFSVVQCNTEEDVIALIDTVLLSNVNEELIRNVKFTGDPKSVGYYYNGFFTGFNDPTGIIITNGIAGDADKSNQCNTGQNASTNNSGIDNDSDLNDISGYSTHDVSIIEFEFKPVSDSVILNYLFASEEYHDFVSFPASDVIGILLSGDGITGTYSDSSENIAILPDTTNTPVSVKTVNFGSGGQTCTGKPTGCFNCQYLKDNSQLSDPTFNVFVYDAYTIPMTASHSVSPYYWNKIKIKIGDGGDQIYDSGLFIEKGSFFNGIYTGFYEKDNHESFKVSGYPNPVSHMYNIKVDYLHDSEIKITFLNTMGKIVHAKSIHHNSGYSNYSFDLYGISPDLYIVKIETEKGMSEQFKLIVY